MRFVLKGGQIFPLRLGDRTQHLLFRIVLGALVNIIRQEWERKAYGYCIGSNKAVPFQIAC